MTIIIRSGRSLLLKLKPPDVCGGGCCLNGATDWRDYTLRMLDILNRFGARHYVKKDLQPFLPPGYPNPMRVPQHH